jgi:hypothetical protein
MPTPVAGFPGYREPDFHGIFGVMAAEVWAGGTAPFERRSAMRGVALHACVAAGLLLIVPLGVFGQDTPEAPDSTAKGAYRLSLEFSPVMMPVGFYGFRLVRPVTQRGNLIGGYMYQNFTNEWGQSHAHTVLVGYQHFVWKGLHGEVELWPAYNRWRSSVDDVVYPGFEIWGEARTGYRIDLETRGKRWYLLPQVLFGTGIWREASPPGPENGTFVFPVLWVGVPLR